MKTILRYSLFLALLVFVNSAIGQDVEILSVTSTPVDCREGNGTSNNGTITITITDIGGPYVYQYSRIGGEAEGSVTTMNTTHTFSSNIIQGPYLIIVSLLSDPDNYAVNSTTVGQPALLTVGITPSPAQACPGVAVQLNGNPNGGNPGEKTHFWFGPGATYLSATNIVDPNFESNIPNSYSITYTTFDPKNCTASQTVNLTVHQQPVSNPGSNDEVCGLSYNLNATPSVGEGQWTAAGPGTATFDDDTDPTTSVTVDAYGTYTFTWTETNVICSDANDVDVVFWEAAIVDAGGPYETCATNPVSLSGSISGSITTGQWLGGLGTFAPNRNTLNATYTAHASEVGSTVNLILESDDPPGVCGPVQSPTSILVRSLPVVTLSNFSPVCIDVPEFPLSGGSPEGGAYSGTGVSGGNFNPLNAGVGTHTITYTYTDGNGCSNFATNTITVNPLPTVNLNPFANVCLNTPPFALTGGTPVGGTYSGTGVSGNTFDPSDAGVGTHTITYTYTDANGCTNNATNTITVNALPVVTLADFSPVCFNAPAFPLSGGAPGGGTYSGPGVSGGNFSPSVAGVGDHTITYTYTDANGCTNTASKTLTVYALPTVTLNNFAPVCVDLPAFALSGGSPAGGVYSGTGVAGGNFDPATAGVGTHTITYTYTDANGCNNFATNTITVNPLPVVTLADFAPVCINNPQFPLSGGLPTGGTYSGTGVSGGNFNPATAGVGTHTITYTYTDGNGCTNSASKTITVNALPVVTLADFSPVCFNAPAFPLSGGAPGGGTYSGPGVSGGNFSPSVAGVGDHTITYTYTDANGCTNTASKTLTVYALPTVTLNNFAPVCVDLPAFALSGGSPAGGVYSGTGVAGGNFDPATAGVGTHTITYTYTDANGCNNFATNTITVNPLPVVTLADFAPVCINNPQFPLSGGLPTGGTYSGTGVSGGNFNPATAGVGTHTITYTYTDGNGCTNSASKTITVNALPVVTLGAFADVCVDGAQFPLSGGSPVGGNYSGPGVSGGNFNPGAAGIGTHTITYSFTDANGCTNTATNTITVNELPNVTLTDFADVCLNTPTFALSGGSPAGGNYSGTGVAGGSFNPSIAGVGSHTITYSYTDPSGCFNSANKPLTVNAIPTQFNVVGGGSYCQGDVGLEVTLSGSQTNTTYTLYRNGNPTATTAIGTGGAISFGLQTEGTYTVLAVNNTTSCQNTMTSSAVIVEIIAIDNNTIAVNQTICAGTAPAPLTGSLPTGASGSYTYQWQISTDGASFSDIGGATNQNYSPSSLTQNTWYRRVVFSGPCSSTSNSVAITVNQPIGNNTITLAQTNICYNTAPNQINGALPTNGGGPGTYTYQWQISTTGAGGPFSNIDGATFRNYQSGVLTQTTWFRRVVSSPPCDASTSNVIQVTVSPEFSITGFTTTNPTCSDGTNGQAEVNHSGGTGPYNYSWTPSGQTTKIAIGLSASVLYTVTVTDNFSCQAAGVNTVTLSAPPPIGIDSYTVTSITVLGGCFGDATGSIQVLANGGTPNYTYSLFRGTELVGTQTPIHPSTALFTGLIASNSYRISVTDANGCTPAEQSGIVLAQPDELIVSNVAVTSAVCYGQSNGTITITAVGGVVPYTYSIDGELGDFEATNTFSVGEGYYEVWIMDSNGCSSQYANNPVYVGQPSPMSVGFNNIQQVTGCNGDSNGIIDIRPFPLPYSDYFYSLAQFPTNDDWYEDHLFEGLPAGTYYPKIKHKVSNCEISFPSPIEIGQPDPIDFTIDNIINVTGCWYSTNGRFRARQPIGGTGIKQVSIDNTTWFNFPRVFTGLGIGTYTVYAKDENDCVSTKTITITGPAPIEITNTVITHLQCFGDTDGEIQITATGGTGALTYTIDGGSPNGTGVFSGLSAGEYLIAIVDVNGCLLETTISVNEPDELLLFTEIVNVSCSFSGNDGKLRARGTGGTTTYTIYLFKGGILQNQHNGVNEDVWVEFENLAAGNDYHIEIDDANGCGLVASPILEIVIPDPLSINIPVVVDPLCSGDATGRVTISASGGTTPYTFILYDNTNTALETIVNNAQAVFEGVAAGTGYYISVDDANTCGLLQTAPFNVDEPDPIVIDLGSIIITHVSCFDLDDGAVTLSATGGTGDRTYTLLQGGAPVAGFTPQASGSFSPLAPGTYVIQVTDEANCSILSNELTVNEPPTLSIAIAVNQNVSCNGGGDGSITATPSGGTTPYQFELNGDGNWVSSGTFASLPAGNHTVVVVDDNGCSATDNVGISEPDAIQITGTTLVNPTCETQGSIAVTATGGSQPLRYTLMPNDVSNTSGLFENLGAGTYQVLVSDINSCGPYSTGDIILTSPSSITIESISVVNATGCFVDNPSNGSITITASGGNPPLQYSIDGGSNYQLSNVFPGLAPGDYVIEVTDGICPAYDFRTITGPAQITYNIVAQIAESTIGAEDGVIIVEALGGTGALTYTLWRAPNTQVSSNAIGIFDNLTNNTYWIVISDALGCTQTTENIILSTLNITLTPTHITCFGGSNGEIALTVDGGTPPYTITWIGPNGPLPAFDNLLNITGLISGSYTVTVEDADGTTVILTQAINEPAAISFNVTVNGPLCFGDASTLTVVGVSGGNGGYTFSFNGEAFGATNSYTFTPTASGEVIVPVVVRDINSCENAQNVTVVVPATLTLSIAVNQNVSCNGGGDGSITATPSGGTTPYQFELNGDGNWVSSGTFASLPAGNHTVVVVDDNGCSATDNVGISEPDAIQITGTTLVNPTCETQGSIAVTATGGSQPLRFTLMPNDVSNTSGIFESLGAGTYQVLVSDINSCGPLSTGDIILTSPSTISIDGITVTHATGCYVDNPTNGSLEIDASGGNGPLTYSIDGGTTFSDNNVFNGLSPNDYVIVVTDGFCPAYDLRTITGPAQITYNIVAGIAESAEEEEDGVIIVEALGGTGALTYTLWKTPGNPVSSNGIGLFDNLSNGTYWVVITDALGCSVTTQNIILSADIPELLVTVQTVSACNGLGGVITLNISSGVEPYNIVIRKQPENTVVYSESVPTEGLYTISDLEASDYSVRVEDNAGQLYTTNVTIGSGNLIVSVASIQNACQGADGSVTFSIAGTPPYTITWDGGSATGTVAGSLGAGTYNFTITDGNNCQVVVEDVIVEGIILTATGTNATCPTSNNGSISLSVSGGTYAPGSPAIFRIRRIGFPWSAWQTNPMFTNLIPATYNVQVMDNNLCYATQTVVIGPDPIVINISTIIPTCFDAGSITATATGGTPPLSYTLYEQVNGLVETNFTGFFEIITGGIYWVSVNDNNSCGPITSDNIVVPSPSDLIINEIIINHLVNCSDPSSGSVVIDATGGQGVLQYGLSPNGPWSNDNIIGGLSAGDYTVWVQDELGCKVFSNITILDNTTITIQVSSSAPTGEGLFNGVISVEVTQGGTQPLTFTLIELGDVIADSGPINQTEYSFTNLPSGKYRVRVTDSYGCTVLSDLITISYFDIEVEVIQHVTCEGYSNGAINITFIEGVPYFTIFVVNDDTGVSYNDPWNNLPPGNYTITATDDGGNGTTVSKSIVIEGQYLEAFAFISTPLTCLGFSDAEVSVNVEGGQEPFTYSWNTNPEQTTQTAIGLPAGTYTVTVTDFGGCEATSTITVEEAEPMVVTATPFPATCFGEASGSIEALCSTGTAPFTYRLMQDDGQVGENITGNAGEWVTFVQLPAGDYWVETIDAVNCTGISETVTIAQPQVVAVSIVATSQPTCDEPGVFTVQAEGGNGSYTFNLYLNGAFEQQVASEGLYSFSIPWGGSYYVEAFDTNGCGPATTETIDFESPVDLDITSVDVTHVLCFGETGSIVVNVTGEVGAVLFRINTGDWQEDNEFTNLLAGDYLIEVVDETQCVRSQLVAINQPDELILTVSFFSPPSSDTEFDGFIMADVDGGTTPYSYYLYRWSEADLQYLLHASMLNTPNNGHLFDGLPSGAYQVVVIDANGCEDSDMVTLGVFAVYLTPTHISCFGQNDGEIEALIIGGIPPYSISWTGPNGALPQFDNVLHLTNLQPGFYMISVEDSNGDIIFNWLDIYEPALLELASLIEIPPQCNNGMDGLILAEPRGGTPPYTITLTLDGELIPDSGPGLFENLSSGTYNLIVTDDNGCFFERPIVLDNPDPISYTLSYIYSSPTETVGDVIEVIASPPSTYQFTLYLVDIMAGTEEAISTNDAGIFTNLSNNIYGNPNLYYYVNIANQNSCELATVGFTKYEPNHVSCNGGDDGYITIYIYGDQIPVISITSVETGESIVGGYSPGTAVLSAGEYLVTLTYPDGNSISQVVVIEEPEPIDVGYTVYQALCYGESTASIEFEISGGNPGYTISWQIDGEEFSTTESTVSSLEAGTYLFTITDQDGCSTEILIEVGEPQEITTSVIATNPTCEESGSIVVVANGGAGNFTYTLMPRPITNDTGVFESLGVGTYWVDVTDGNGCQISTEAITLSSPSTIVIENIFTVDATGCFGEANNGSITIIASGGEADLWYSIDDGENFFRTNFFENLEPGFYKIVVTDYVCPNFSFAEVFGPEPITYEIAIQQPENPEGAVNGIIHVRGAGGTGVLTYTLIRWVNGNPNEIDNNETGQFLNLVNGVYQVVIADEAGCSVKTEFILLNAIHLILEPTHITCFGLSNGSIKLTVLGGTRPYSITWSTTFGPLPDFDNLETIVGLNAGTYFVQVIDDAGLSATASVQIAAPNAIEVLVTDNVSPLCFGDSNGYLELSISGGTEPYTISWGENSVPIVDLLEGLAAGEYQFTISDANGCTVPLTVTIAEPDPILFEVTQILNPLCHNGEDGSVTFAITGGTPAFTISWDESSIILTDNTLTGLGSGEYLFTLTDANMCQVTLEEPVTLINPDALNLVSLYVYDLLCNGNGNGEISMWASGGTQPITYTIVDSEGNATSNNNGIFTGLASGSYDLFITDVNSCNFGFPEGNRVVVNEPSPLGISDYIFSTDDTLECHNYKIDYVRPRPVGGTPNYNLYWYSINSDEYFNTPDLLNAHPGFYECVVTDANACVFRDTIRVPGPLRPIYTTVVDTANCRVSNSGDIGAIEITNIQGGTGTFSNDFGVEWFVGSLSESLPNSTGRWKVQALRTGNYFAVVSYAAESTEPKTCKDTVEFFLPYNIDNEFSFAIRMEDNTDVIKDIFCWGEEANLRMELIQGSVGEASYKWYNETDDPDEVVSTINRYKTPALDEDKVIYLEVVSEIGCLETKRVTVVTYPQIGPYLPREQHNFFSKEDLRSFGNDTTVISVLADTEYSIQVFTIHPDINLTYSWTPIDFFEPNNSGTPTMFFPTTVYEPHLETGGTIVNVETNREEKYIPLMGLVQSEYGCREEINLKARILNKVNTSNVFSPNDDGINDTWTIPYSDLFPNLEIKIYNRWGALVWSAKGGEATKGWNGNNRNGKPLPSGTYYYVINFNVEGTTKWKPIAGSVTIIK